MKVTFEGSLEELYAFAARITSSKEETGRVKLDPKRVALNNELLSLRSSPIQAIKLYRSQMSCSLKEAKDYVEALFAIGLPYPPAPTCTGSVGGHRITD
jgi:ribosomal protein L7/L12